MEKLCTVLLRAAFAEEIDQIACLFAGVLAHFPKGERLVVESYFATRCLCHLDGIGKDCQLMMSSPRVDTRSQWVESVLELT